MSFRNRILLGLNPGQAMPGDNRGYGANQAMPGNANRITAIHFHAEILAAPVDATTYYIGCHDVIPDTVAANELVYMEYAGTITRANIQWLAQGVAGTAEAVSLNIRLNNASDTLIATVSTANAIKAFRNTAVALAVAAGDFLQLKLVCPTWVTNPTNVSIAGNLWLAVT